MISIEGVSNGVFEDISLSSRPSEVLKIVTSSGFERDRLLEMLSGLRAPHKGKVVILGHDIYALPEKEGIAVFQNVGVIWRDGGIISNLKVWENIMLPAWYHMGLKPADVEQKVIGLLLRLGSTESEVHNYMGKLPGLLPEYVRLKIGLVRAMLMDPDVMIYDSIFEDLDPSSVGRFAELTREFHQQKEDRASVYISSDEQSLGHVETHDILRQQGKGF